VSSFALINPVPPSSVTVLLIWMSGAYIDKLESTNVRAIIQFKLELERIICDGVGANMVDANFLSWSND
jgi:hypothetical protein